MRRFVADMNPSLRGFLILASIALVIVVLNLTTALASLYLIARIAFFLAIAFFVYLLWRDRREEIGAWPDRARFAFYGGVAVIVATIASFILFGAGGLAAAAGLLAIIVSGYAMYRTWREQRSFGY